jgi:hypothetical protein
MSRLQCPSEGEEAERHQRVVPFIERVTGHRLLFTSTLGMGFFSWTVGSINVIRGYPGLA